MPRSVLLVLLGVLALPACKRPAPPHAPDVILVTVDTVRVDRFETASTPTLDGLAKRGVRFTEATTPLPRTTPALASLLTGLYAQHHGSREVGQPMTRGTSLATVLKDRGYRTVGVCSNPVSGRGQHVDQGFEVFVERRSMPSDLGAVVTKAALEQTAQVPKDAPMLLWVHYMDPHFFYEPPKAFQPGPEADGCRALVRRVKARRIASGHVYADLGGISSRVLDGCRALYDGEIASADHEVGRLLAGLKAQGRDVDHALVVFTSDHGENQGEGHLYYEHGPNLAEAVLRVPLILAGPGLPKGKTVGGLARLQDVAPTILDLLGVAPDRRPAADGTSLLPAIRGTGPAPSLAFAESASALHARYFPALSSGRAGSLHCLNGPRWSLCRDGAGPARLYDHQKDPDLRRDLSASAPEVKKALEAAATRWPAEEARERSVRTERFKLVATPRLEGGYALALYDLKADPGATVDVSAAHPAEKARLEAALDRWSSDLPGYVPPERTDEDLEDLRNLGYVQ